MPWASSLVQPFAETLIGIVPAATTNLNNLQVPPGTQSIRVFCSSAARLPFASTAVVGSQTLTAYSGMGIYRQTGTETSLAMPWDPSTGDSQVNVTCSAGAVPVYVVAVASPVFGFQVVQPVTAAVPGSGSPAQAELVGGLDGGGTLQALPVAVAGAAQPANVLQIGGNDGTDIRALPVAVAGAAKPLNVLQIGGNDGTDARVLETDASGRLVLPPATGSLSTFTSISTSSGGTALFGVVGSAINGKGGTLSVGIYSYTQIAGQELLISLSSTGAGGPGVLATLIVPLVGTTVAGAGVFIVVPLDFGAGGVTIPSNGSLGALEVGWTYSGALTAIGGWIGCNVVY